MTSPRLDSMIDFFPLILYALSTHTWKLKSHKLYPERKEEEEEEEKTSHLPSWLYFFHEYVRRKLMIFRIILLSFLPAWICITKKNPSHLYYVHYYTVQKVWVFVGNIRRWFFWGIQNPDSINQTQYQSHRNKSK